MTTISNMENVITSIKKAVFKSPDEELSFVNDAKTLRNIFKYKNKDFNFSFYFNARDFDTVDASMVHWIMRAIEIIERLQELSRLYNEEPKELYMYLVNDTADDFQKKAYAVMSEEQTKSRLMNLLENKIEVQKVSIDDYRMFKIKNTIGDYE